MSSNEKYMLLKTYYDIEEAKRTFHILDSNNISYRVNDKSNFQNFRIPNATYIEIDLLIKSSEYAEAYNILINKTL